MAVRYQGSPRDNEAVNNLRIGASGGVYHGAYSDATALIGANSTGLTTPGKLRIGAAQYVGANSTGVLQLTTVAAIPSTRIVGGICIVSNSTSKAIAFHQTGTTWVWASATSVQPS